MTKPWESVIPEVQEQLDQEKPSFVARFARNLGRGTALAGRTVAQGAYDMISPFTNAAAGTMNLGLAGMEKAGVDIPGLNESYRFPEQTGEFDRYLDMAGLPRPEGVAENIGNFAGRVATGYGISRLTTPAVMERLGFKLPERAPPPPSSDQLRSAAQQAYRNVDNAGVTVANRSLRPVLDRATQAAKGLGYDEQLHPRVAAVLNRFAQTTDDISFQDLEILRRVVKNAASSADGSERRIAQEIIGQLDDYVVHLGAGDVVSGNASAASLAIREARNLYSRSAKASEIEELITRARNAAPNFSASGLENALRTQFRQLANNPRRMRLFSSLEREAIERVARGGTLDNALRYLGKLAPTGVVSGAPAVGAYAAGGPAAAAAVAGTGYASRYGATQMTLRNVNQLSELVRRGGPAASGAGREAAIAAGATPAIVNFLWGEASKEEEQEPSRKPWD